LPTDKIKGPVTGYPIERSHITDRDRKEDTVETGDNIVPTII
jgi:hypothetical protein